MSKKKLTLNKSKTEVMLTKDDSRINVINGLINIDIEAPAFTPVDAAQNLGQF